MRRLCSSSSRSAALARRAAAAQRLLHRLRVLEWVPPPPEARGERPDPRRGYLRLSGTLSPPPALACAGAGAGWLSSSPRSPPHVPEPISVVVAELLYLARRPSLLLAPAPPRPRARLSLSPSATYTRARCVYPTRTPPTRARPTSRTRPMSFRSRRPCTTGRRNVSLRSATSRSLHASSPTYRSVSSLPLSLGALSTDVCLAPDHLLCVLNHGRRLVRRDHSRHAFTARRSGLGHLVRLLLSLLLEALPLDVLSLARRCWFIGSVFCFCLGLSIAELVSAYPTSGGLYSASAYLVPHRYRALVGWVVGWRVLLPLLSLLSLLFLLLSLFSPVTAS